MNCLLIFICVLFSCVHSFLCYAIVDVKFDEKARQNHKNDSLNILAYTLLLIATVLTIWLFKKKRARYLHETGLAIFYGLIVGAIIRYAGDPNAGYTSITSFPSHNNDNDSSVLQAPPDSILIPLLVEDKVHNSTSNRTYMYTFKRELMSGYNYRAQKAVFDPEIFFNIILPPIIFNAGYSLKRRFFFKNLGAIMAYAFFGTTISCFVVALILWGLMALMPAYGFSFADCLFFGAIISATDPVTVLAIFTDLHVDVTLYALVFGESILNDAVAIVLAVSVDSVIASQYYTSQEMNAINSTITAVTNFVYIFSASFFLGSFIGCVTALLTKFTRLLEFPILETCLLVLMSYSAFLLAEVIELSGIVTVLFCGICQAHYTYNNLSPESRARTKQLFELLSFIAENFIFTYLGVSMFTYPTHKWLFGFILVAFIAILCGRAMNIYPLTFILNLGRNNKIPLNYQNVLFFSGLRGAMAYALAIRNTLSEPRQIMFTTTSVIAIVTVIACGGFTSTVLQILEIPTDVEETEHEMLPFSGVKRSGSMATSTHLHSPSSSSCVPSGQQPTTQGSLYEKAWLIRKWYNFDVRFMKPLLTHARPTLIDTLPDCCFPLSRLLTSTEQLSNDNHSQRKVDKYESDYFIDDDDILTPDPFKFGEGVQNFPNKNYSFGHGQVNKGFQGFNSESRVCVNNIKCDSLDDKVIDVADNGISHISNVSYYKSFASSGSDSKHQSLPNSNNFI